MQRRWNNIIFFLYILNDEHDIIFFYQQTPQRIDIQPPQHGGHYLCSNFERSKLNLKSFLNMKFSGVQSFSLARTNMILAYYYAQIFLKINLCISHNPCSITEHLQRLTQISAKINKITWPSISNTYIHIYIRIYIFSKSL